jgi:hypothetical protein
MPADASGLLGSTLEWQYYGGGGPYNPVGAGLETNGSFVDNGSVGGTFIEPDVSSGDPVTVFNIDADDSTITFDFSAGAAVGPESDSPLSLAPTIYNGIAINLLSGGSFSSVTIDSATNMSGFAAGDLSFSPDQIQVNWANLNFDDTTMVILDVNYSTTNPVPEPATIFLFLISALVARWGRFPICPARLMKTM